MSRPAMLFRTFQDAIDIIRDHGLDKERYFTLRFIGDRNLLIRKSKTISTATWCKSFLDPESKNPRYVRLGQFPDIDLDEALKRKAETDIPPRRNYGPVVKPNAAPEAQEATKGLGEMLEARIRMICREESRRVVEEMLGA